MTFRMSLGSTQKSLTALVLVICVVAPLWSYLSGSDAPNPSTMVVVITALGIAWAHAPRAVQVTVDELLILRRAMPPVRVRADEVVQVSDGPTAASLRLCGSGGFMGSFGLFWRSQLGWYWLYTAASQRPTALLRRRRGLPVVVSVDDQAGLHRALAKWRKPR